MFLFILEDNGSRADHTICSDMDKISDCPILNDKGVRIHLDIPPQGGALGNKAVMADYRVSADVTTTPFYDVVTDLREGSDDAVK